MDSDINSSIEELDVKVDALSRSLGDAGLFLEIFAGLATVGSIVAGLILALHTNTDSNGSTTYPDLAIGIALTAGGLVGGIFYWAIARTIRLFAHFTAANIGALAQVLDFVYNSRSARSKECPDCLEDIWDEAKVCPHCHHRFASVSGR